MINLAGSLFSLASLLLDVYDSEDELLSRFRRRTLSLGRLDVPESLLCGGAALTARHWTVKLPSLTLKLRVYPRENTPSGVISEYKI